LLSLPRGTEMFQFPRFPLPAVCVQAGVTPHDGCRVSPFGYPRIKAWSAAPRGFSQPPTSFIGVRRQGIHRWLFVAWKNKDARARYAVLKELGGGPSAQHPGHEDAGAATRWPCRRRLEEMAGATPSKQKTGQCVEPELDHREGRTLRPAMSPGPDRARLQLGVAHAVRMSIDSLERR
jgi:hypothetical protein